MSDPFSKTCGKDLWSLELVLIVSIGRQFPQLGRGPKVRGRRARLEQTLWKGLGWIQTGVWPALSVAAFERTTQVEVPPLSFFVFIQTSLPGWCLAVALLVDVVVWMIVGNPQYR